MSTVHVELMYDEVGALLRAFVEADDLVGMWKSTSSGGGGGGAPPCAICYEEMETTCLPGCGHGRCIGRWFEKTSTCLVCRRDKL